jgi:hypothetical protein
VHLWTGAQQNNLLQGPPMFGNLIVRNKVRQPHATRTTFDWNFHTDGGILVGNRSGRDMTRPKDRRVAVSHTIVQGNQVSYTGQGIAVADTARKSFLLGNEFEAHPTEARATDDCVARSSSGRSTGASSLFGFCRSFKPRLAVGRAEPRSSWLESEKRHRYFPALQPFTAQSTLPPDEPNLRRSTSRFSTGAQEPSSAAIACTAST